MMKAEILVMGETGFWKIVELESPSQGTGTDPSRKISSSGKEESSHNLLGKKKKNVYGWHPNAMLH